jgi:carboxymethylenebutenolidase
MIEQTPNIQTKDGSINTFIASPAEGGPHPIVLFLMDAPGKREELHEMVRRLAAAGYYVMLPNLYYRRVREFDMMSTTREVMFEHMNSLSNAMACEDIQALLDFAATDAAASDGKIGCVGYCMSGPFAFAAAAAFPERVAASASIHGIRLCTDADDSPHLDAGKITGEIYFGCAETDDYAPTEMIENLGEHLRAVGTSHRIEWYPGTEHGFVFPQRGALYHEESAERHWDRLLAMYSRCL